MEGIFSGGSRGLKNLRGIFLILSLNVFFLFKAEASPIKHVRVIWHEKPTQDSIIAWTTKILDWKGRLYIDIVPRQGKLENYKWNFKPDLKIYTGTTYFRHHVSLQDLAPNSTYYFTVTSRNHKSVEYSFKTAPGAGQDFKLLLGGDSRTDRKMRREMNLRIKELFKTKPEIVALVHGGDYTANGMLWNLWEEWLDDNADIETADHRLLPIVPIRGNHEYLSPLYNDVFVRPGKGLYKNYYVSDFGDLALVNLNSNTSMCGEQKDWLKETLGTLSKDKKWIAANYHRPAYPAFKKPGGALKHWVPLFEEHKLDLVFESDGHVLKKTLPIYKGKMDLENGITYVGEGGLGVPLRVPRTDFWYLQKPGYAVAEHHVMMLSMEKEKMVFSVHLLNGNVFDQMNFLPKRR